MMFDLNIIAVIQCTPDDLFDSRDPNDYCISALKQSKIFSRIILAVPKLDNYKIFEDLAKEWGIDIFYGSNYNVAERLYNAAKPFSPDIVVRVLLKAFFIDMELVKKMINELKNDIDYVNCDKNYNYALAADVLTFNALQKIVKKLTSLPNDFESNMARFSPWPFIEHSKDFQVHTIFSSKMWEKSKILHVKNKLKHLFDNQENKQSIKINNPISRYRFVSNFIEKNDTVLDIASGQGGGTALLSDFSKFVYGVDYNKEYIENSNNSFKNKNLEFIYGTEEILKELNIQFDKIVSLHTLEHVPNDKNFLKTLFQHLKPSGRLILEVPRLLEYPLGEPLYPFHVKEYVQKDLELLFQEIGFKIDVSYGGSRNHYVPIKDTREVLFYVLKK